MNQTGAYSSGTPNQLNGLIKFDLHRDNSSSYCVVPP